MIEIEKHIEMYIREIVKGGRLTRYRGIGFDSKENSLRDICQGKRIFIRTSVENRIHNGTDKRQN